MSFCAATVLLFYVIGFLAYVKSMQGCLQALWYERMLSMVLFEYIYVFLVIRTPCILH
jgi:hypothetical protein